MQRHLPRRGCHEYRKRDSARKVGHGCIQGTCVRAQPKVQAKADLVSRTPLSTYMTPGQMPPLKVEQVAELLVFLASPASEGINGAQIPIDEGWCTL